jgi:hypothetical protein
MAKPFAINLPVGKAFVACLGAYGSTSCCLFPWLGATNAHHLHYAHLRSERTVRDIVPLSKAGHRVAHA